MKPSIKYQVILKNKDKYSISKICRFFDVSRKEYYNYLHRKNIPAKDLILEENIREYQSKPPVVKCTPNIRQNNIWGALHIAGGLIKPIRRQQQTDSVRKTKSVCFLKFNFLP